jgi:hypothetical protein
LETEKAYLTGDGAILLFLGEDARGAVLFAVAALFTVVVIVATLILIALLLLIV